MKQKTRILIYILIAIVVVILGSMAILTNHNASNPMSAQEKIDLGHAYLLDLSYEKAALKFTEAIEIDPMNADAYLGLAEAYQGMGDIDKAIEALETGYEKTGDQRLKDKLDELSPSVETLVTVPDLAGMTKEEALSVCEELGISCDVKTEESDTVEKDHVISQSVMAGANVPVNYAISVTVSEGKKVVATEQATAENNLIDKAISDAKKIQSIYNSNEITMEITNYASYAEITDTNLLYYPEYFLNNSSLEYSGNVYCKKDYNYAEIICGESPYQYELYDMKTFPVSNAILLSGNIYMYDTITFAADSQFFSHNEGYLLFDEPHVFYFNLYEENYNNIEITSYDNVNYNAIEDKNDTPFIYVENFNGFVRKYTADEYISYDFWTNISDTSYTHYSIHTGTVNGKGNFIVEKYVYNIGYPQKFNETLWDQIHDIDEVKAALNK